MCKRKLRSCSKKFKSFLPPSLVFYPTFLALKFGQISRSKLIFTDIPTLKKWGKKLVRGVKNFCIIKCKHLTFICTKNQKKIFKTRKNILKWNLMTIKKKIWKFFENFQIFKIVKNEKKYKKFILNMNFSKKLIFTSFEDFFIIFCAKESWDHARKNSKVFYPPH